MKQFFICVTMPDGVRNFWLSACLPEEKFQEVRIKIKVNQDSIFKCFDDENFLVLLKKKIKEITGYKFKMVEPDCFISAYRWEITLNQNPVNVKMRQFVVGLLEENGFEYFYLSAEIPEEKVNEVQKNIAENEKTILQCSSGESFYERLKKSLYNCTEYQFYHLESDCAIIAKGKKIIF